MAELNGVGGAAWEGLTMLFEHLQSIAARSPSGNGVREGERVLTYDALCERISRLASGLAARGIGRGSVVGTILHNGPQLFEVVHALFALGAIAMPLSPGATQAECAVAARKAKVSAIVTFPERAEFSRQVISDVEEGQGVVLLVADEDGPEGLQPLYLTPVGSLPAPPPNTTGLYLFSSGSTGLPKIVPHTQAELLADGRRTSGVWSLTSDDTVIDVLPPNFAMGLLLGTVYAVEAGANVVYWRDARPLMISRRSLLEALVRERISFMGAVPAIYDTLAGATDSVDLPRMRGAFSGGAALKRQTFEAVRARFGVTLRQSYGSTEALFVAHNTQADPDATWASVGPAAGDAQVRIDPVESDLGPDVGELLVRSLSLTSGYLDEPDLNSRALADGWLRTGDLATLDQAGNITIRGRSKLLIEVAGFKIDPIEVEAALQTHPAVAEAVVVGVRAGRDGATQLKAFIVPSDHVSADLLVRHTRQRLSQHKVPTLFEFREDLPRSSAGKVLRSQLAQEA